MFKLVSDGIFGWVSSKNRKEEITKLIYISFNGIFIWLNYYYNYERSPKNNNLVTISRILFAQLSPYLR